MRLFDRRWSVTLGDRDVSDLDLAFEIERKTRGAAGVATVTIRNPAPDTIAAARRDALIRVSAGYADEAIPMLFSGRVRSAEVKRTGPDRDLTITGRDVGSAYAEGAVLSRSYAAGSRVADTARDCITALGIGLGNANEITWALRGGGETWPAGYAAHGSARRTLSEIVAAIGYRWSVQHGAFAGLPRGGASTRSGEVLTPDTGLIESPTWDERRRVLSARALIRPGLEPGRRVRVESDAATGDFEVAACKWVGDTAGADWFADLSLRALR